MGANQVRCIYLSSCDSCGEHGARQHIVGYYREQLSATAVCVCDSSRWEVAPLPDTAT